MNQQAFVSALAEKLFQEGVRMAYQEDSGMVEKCPPFFRPMIINTYRTFMAESEVTLVVPFDATDDQLWTLLYESLWETLCNSDTLSNLIDDALWAMQNNREEDYSQEQEDRARGEIA